uniref:Secreted protein n=1 Tax=Panagrellus redivivus TaxID=6233 RepID=A0A7E4ZTZ4_PANRE
MLLTLILIQSETRTPRKILECASCLSRCVSTTYLWIVSSREMSTVDTIPASSSSQSLSASRHPSTEAVPYYLRTLLNRDNYRYQKSRTLLKCVHNRHNYTTDVCFQSSAVSDHKKPLITSPGSSKMRAYSR